MTFKRMWSYDLEKTATPGVYRMKPVGHFVRAKVTDPTGIRHEVTGVLAQTRTTKEARAELDRLVAAERATWQGATQSTQPWIDFAVSRLEERVRTGHIKSQATIDWWRGALDVFAEAWGPLNVTSVGPAIIQRWLDTTVQRWMTTGRTTKRKRRDGKNEVEVTKVLKPPTVNGWLRVLRAISNAAAERFDLPRHPMKGITFFMEGRAHTKENPNALGPALLPMFMAAAKALYPQHYAMMLLGFVTGLRPSSLRPLRRRGPEADIDWDTGVLLVRRSHARRQKVMDRTKQGVDGSIALPLAILDVLRDHAMALDGAGGKLAGSDLLFPSEAGGLRTRQGLTRPFARIVAALKLPFKLTPKGMRRTFNDAMRTAGTHDVVTRSISGHQTEEMQRHYSTAQAEEQREALTRAHAMITAPRGEKKGGSIGGDNA